MTERFFYDITILHISYVFVRRDSYCMITEVCLTATSGVFASWTYQKKEAPLLNVFYMMYNAGYLIHSSKYLKCDLNFFLFL